MIMRLLLIIHTLLAVVTGALILFLPTLFFPDIHASSFSSALSTSLVRNYGITTMVMGALSGLMLMRPLTQEVKFVGLGTLAIFYLGMTIFQLLNLFEGLVPIPVLAVNGVFLLLFIATFIWNK